VKGKLMHPDAFRLTLLLLREMFEGYLSSKQMDNNPGETARYAREAGEVLYQIRKEAEAQVKARINKSARLPAPEDAW